MVDKVFKVTRVASGGRGDESGLKDGDQFLTINDEIIESPSAFFSAREAAGIEPVELKVLRGSEVLELIIPEGKLDIDFDPTTEGVEKALSWIISRVKEKEEHALFLEKKVPSIKVFTADAPHDLRIKASLGIARGGTVRARHVGRDILADMKNIIGGEVKSYTKLLADGREEALVRMKADAARLGADAVIAVRFSTAAIQDGVVEVMAYGTAIELEDS